jgi:uncharacterized membrane protein
MHNQVLNILLKWLDNNGYKIDTNKFETLFLSHPDSGDIVSITDTLNDFNIENTVAEIPKESITELKDPFIAFVKNNNQNIFVLAHLLNNEIIIIDTGNKKSIEVTIKEFSERWNGLVIVIDKKPILFELSKTNRLICVLTLAVLGLFLCLNSNSLNIFSVFHFGLSVIGITLSIFIITHELGIKSSIVDKVCNLNTITNCSAVLSSQTGKIYKSIGLNDLGIVYFVVQILMWIILSIIDQNGFNSIFTISLLALPITLYSIYVQKSIIKKWCPLCLGIICVLWLQGILALSHFFAHNSISFNIGLKIPITFFLTTVIVSIVWALLKPLLQNATKHKNLHINELSFRRNYRLFMPFYKNQQIHKMQIAGLEDFSIGNINTPVTITAILSLDCPICNYTNDVLNRLCKKYPNDIKIGYRLLSNPNKIEDIKTKAAVYLLSLFNEYNKPNDTLTKWYNKRINEQLYSGITITEKQNSEIGILNKYEHWCMQNGISYTPAIFINGKLFPNFYDKADLKYFMEEIIQYEVAVRSSTDAAVASPTMVLVDNT